MKSINLSSTPQIWRQMVERKEDSPYAEEQSALFAGLDFENGAPVVIPRNLIDEGHIHVSGRTGCGKTVTTLISSVYQMLRADAKRITEAPSPIVIIDLKGDQPFFHAVRQAANEYGRTFRYFSTRVGDDYHFFDPFQIFRVGSVTPLGLASEFIRAFSLDYGLIYGGLYYTHQNLAVLYDAIREIQSTNVTPTIGSLSKVLDRIGKRTNNRDAQHILSCLKFLEPFEQVNIEMHPEPPQNTIDMLRALDQSEVVYFFLQLEAEAPSLRQIASLAMYTLVEAAKERQSLGLPKRNTMLVIDEFYHIAGKSFGDLLSTIRYLGIHLLLANQERSQLESHDKSLPSIVEANCAVQLVYTMTTDEIERMAFESGQVKELLKSVTIQQPLNRRSYSEKESWTTRLTAEELQWMNDTRLGALLLVKDRNARTGERVRKLQTLYPIPKSLYDLYRDTPLPRKPAVMDPPSAPPSSTNEPVGTTKSAQADVLHERMQLVWRALEQAEKLDSNKK